MPVGRPAEAIPAAKFFFISPIECAVYQFFGAIKRQLFYIA